MSKTKTPKAKAPKVVDPNVAVLKQKRAAFKAMKVEIAALAAKVKAAKVAAKEANAKARATRKAAAVAKAKARLEALLAPPAGAKAIKAAKKPSKPVITKVTETTAA